MIDNFVVKDVVEKNDCAGKKLIYVTSMERDELIPSHFQMTRSYMFSDDKLALASVSPMDRIKIIPRHYLHDTNCDILISGDYIENLENLSHRTPLCRCGTHMVSDGFDVYCPNVNCALTITAQLERLAHTSFFSHHHLDPTPDNEIMRELNLSPLRTMDQQKPFLPIVQGLFWGRPGGTLDETLLKTTYPVSLSTFLIEPLFKEFIESNAFIGRENIIQQNNFTYEAIFRFYADMTELVNRRNFTNPRQNKLIFDFIWSLGIQSLSENLIFMLTQYERVLDSPVDPVVGYAYVLTHSSELVNELRLHRLEALTIINEVRRRRFELCDIFTRYSNWPNDIAQCFNTIG